VETKRISMVVMNWLRPEVLRYHILPDMTKYELIHEIIISHGREDTYFEFDHPKIVNRKDWGEINEYYGLSRRFLAASKASNEIILMIDDDGYPSESMVQKIFYSYNKNPKRMYGFFGRNTKYKHYNLHQRYKEVCVLITKCTLFNKELCAEFFKYSDSKDVLDIIKTGQPHWNGEDVFMSAVARNYYGNNNFCIKTSEWINPINGRENKRKRSVSSWKNHRLFRTELIHFCAKKFNIWSEYTQ